MKKVLLSFMLGIVTLLALSGCTDADQAALFSYGSKTDVKCWSGGQLIFSDESTGKVAIDQSGIYYKSVKTGNLVHTYADCIVSQE